MTTAAGVGTPISAQEDYPPGAFTITLSASVVAPGASVTATVTLCEEGVAVRISVGGTSIQRDVPCQAQSAPRATATFNAPTTPGQYTVRASELGGQGRTATALLTVSTPGGPAEVGPPPQTSGSSSLPSTGSNIIDIVAYGAAAIVLGLGGVVAARRHRLAPRR